MCIDQFIEKNPLTVAPETVLLDAIGLINQKQHNSSFDQRSEQRESPKGYRSAYAVLGVSPMSNFRKKAPSFDGGVISD
ncbi:MAG: hypothetical protein QNJ18_20045, partial [Xenococcaceae cyanobacterium MO_167.B52]|nr:hypothetical protein [Xenococcaceae cyanobacterium MO_167.B52]